MVRLFNRSSLEQETDQFPPGTVYPGLDRTEWAVESRGDLRVAQFLLVKQSKSLGVVGTNLRQGALYFLGQLFRRLQPGSPRC